MPDNEIPQFKSMEDMAAATAKNLAKAAAGSAFTLFNDKTFRQLARFNVLPVVEHDRIFNELLVAGLTLQMLTLEAPDLHIPDDMRPFLKQVANEIPATHVRELAGMGVEEEHLGVWRQLISMRYEEYAADRHKARAASMQIEIEAARRPLDREAMDGIQAMVPVQVVAIGTHCHVCRGKTEEYDELFKFMLNHLSRFYVEMRLTFEGRPLTSLDRAAIAVKRLFRKKF
ncbi:MAG: hypothetical protein WC637_12020 [Victivallales bacterium]|jgi:hypothetical protein